MIKFIADVYIRRQDANGNTYHEITLIDGTTGNVINSTKSVYGHAQYGYGSAYQQTITALINTVPSVGVYTDEMMRKTTLILCHNSRGVLEACFSPLNH